MKKLLVTLMLTLVSTSTMADWTAVSGDDEITGYADFTTIRKVGNKIKMWILSDYKTLEEVDGDKFLSSKQLWEFDCKEEQQRIVANSTFSGNMGAGKVNYSTSDTGKWKPVAPGSIGKTYWKIACNKK